MSLTFTVGGKTVTADDLKEVAKKTAKRPPPASAGLKRTFVRDEATVSDGFVVVGYSPEHWAQRIKDHEEALSLHASDPNSSKPPGTLDEFTVRWLSKNKPKRARARPYEIASAADQCADLMRKAGWLHVRVDEILKG